MVVTTSKVNGLSSRMQESSKELQASMCITRAFCVSLNKGVRDSKINERRRNIAEKGVRLKPPLS